MESFFYRTLKNKVLPRNKGDAGNLEQYIDIEAKKRVIAFLQDVIVLQRAYERSLKEILRANDVEPPNFIYTDEEMFKILK